jgi:pyruvate formate lyase activating enzyme
MPADVSATVLNIQRTSTEDGPGLRTTVFLKGCSLACGWCHNPEAMESKPELVWYRSRCIGAGACVGCCQENALSRLGDGAVVIDHGRCTACGDCVVECPSAALDVLGERWSVDDLVAEIAKDASFFEVSGGGVTVSGGEPALHAQFVARFLERCRGLGLHTAVDTCGMCSFANLETLVAHADLVLYDLKAIDSLAHRRLTGQANDRILANFIDLAARMRTGATLDDENVLGLGFFIATHARDVVSRWELCAFNNLAGDKYERLGRTWAFADVPLLTAEELAHAADVARRSGLRPGTIVATGRTRSSSRGAVGGSTEVSDALPA